MSSDLRRKVLVITYYWPPSGGSSVLRWLKFARYLHEFGWSATIYTPGNPEPQAYDPALSKEIPDSVTVIKRKIWEPYRIFKFLTGQKHNDTLTASFVSERKKGWIYGLMIWIRGNFFIPDARKFWIRPSIRYLSKYLADNPHDAIISTGPPHSMHLIAMGIKARMNIPWLADFRDPWTNIDFYNELKLSSLADRKHRLLEKKVLASADAVITVGPTMTAEFKNMGCSKVFTITNGYDEISDNPAIESVKGFSFLHVGSMSSARNPRVLWTVLGNIASEDQGFRSDLVIHLIGKVDYTVLRSITESGLEDNLKKQDHIPHYQVFPLLKQASVLLLVINDSQNAGSILTNKFYEYLSAGRPILGIGPEDGDAAFILNRSGGGRMIDYNNRKELHDHIIDLYNRYKSGKLITNVRNISQYNRRNLTAELAALLDSVVSKSDAPL